MIYVILAVDGFFARMINCRLHITLRLALHILGIMMAITLVAALAIQYRIHVANEWQQYASVPPMAAPSRNDSVMVFAPHSDDETLGCGGMLALAVRNYIRVNVVLVTNGDGFRVAVGRAYKTLNVTPAKCIEFAYKRQRETLNALETLGVSSEHVTFLGYPDRGIARMWNTFWDEDTLYLSRATGSDHSPYDNSFTPNAPYCGDSLLKDIMRILTRDKPTDVYVPHPLDNHPDHYATYCFVAAAIEQLISEHQDFAKKVRLHTYLVHRGDWPVPKGNHPTEQLAPPYAMASGDTEWLSLQLGADIARMKRSAIRRYKTQTDIEKNFLMSFARENEIFGSVPDRKVKNLGSRKIAIDGDPEDWHGIPPAAVDPVGDYVMAGLNKGGDVRAIYLCSDGRFLYVRMDCAKKLSKQINYTVNMRGISDMNTDDWYTISIRPPRRCSPRGTLWAYHDNILEMALPLNRLQLDADAFIQVRTTMMKLTVDQTGWHGVKFESN
ncbi:MAG: PIG-L deacetylase family protein [Armatimonadota bacterium]